MIVDVHSHLTFPDFKKDLNEVIERAKGAGVVSIISSGTSIESNKEVLELSKKFQIVKASLGAYPTEVKKSNIDEQLEFIKKNKAKIVAIGEAGLDYKELQNKEEQKFCFEKVITLAEKLNKPLVVHSRKAESDALDLIESSKLKKVIMHCFTPKMSIVKRAQELGYNFSIPTVITRLEHFQEMVKRIPLNQLLTETDAPFLSPFRGKRNEPSFIVESLKKMAEIKNMDVKEVENNIYMNYQKLFL
jgi:TatD DNase family protein